MWRLIYTLLQKNELMKWTGTWEVGTYFIGKQLARAFAAPKYKDLKSMKAQTKI